MFKLQSILKTQKHCCPKLCVKLFNSLVRPILTYGCQVWGTRLIKHVTHGTPEIDKLDLEAPEKLCNSFLKYLLGVPKYSPNSAVKGELGIYPAYIFILKQVTSYWEHLKTHPDKLASSAMQDGAIGPNSWISQVKQLITKTQSNQPPATTGKRSKTKG